MNQPDNPPNIKTTASPRTLLIEFCVPALVVQSLVSRVGLEILEAHDGHPDLYLIVSFEGVQSISSGMLGKLITLHRRAQRAGRHLVLCHMGPVVEEMFTSSRLDDYFTIVPDVQSAKAFLKQYVEDADAE